MADDFVSFDLGSFDQEADFDFDIPMENPKLPPQPSIVVLPTQVASQPPKQGNMTNQMSANFNPNNLNNVNQQNEFSNVNQPVHVSKSPIPQPVFITPLYQTESSSVEEMRTEAIEGNRNENNIYHYSNDLIEGPLLEELGIDFKQIGKNILTKLNPFTKYEITESDAVGSLVFGLLLGLLCLFMKKFKFGYIYGFTIIGSILEYFVLNLLANTTISYSNVLTHLGYSSYPLIIVSIVHLFVGDSQNIWVILLTCFMCLWSTYSCGKSFIRDQGFNDKKLVVYYPIALYFILFVLLVLF